MVGILHGEFVKFRELSHLAEEEEGYGEFLSNCNLRRNWFVGSEPRGAIGSMMKSHFRVS
jgi:hypothetical protein